MSQVSSIRKDADAATMRMRRNYVDDRQGALCKSDRATTPPRRANHSGNIPGRQVQWAQMMFVGASLAARCRQEGVQPDGGYK